MPTVPALPFRLSERQTITHRCRTIPEEGDQRSQQDTDLTAAITAETGPLESVVKREDIDQIRMSGLHKT